MSTKNLLIILIILIILVGGYWWYEGSRFFAKSDLLNSMMTDEEMVDEMSENMTPDQAMTVAEEGESMLGGESTNLVYKGERLAGDKSPLLEFTPEDYAAAKLSDKLVVLYFYANWCPVCREEFPKMEDAFDELSSDKVIGFRVNYNDNETSEAERELAREFGVAYQHTKVLLKNGERIGKYPDSWDKERYLTEINSSL